MVKFLIVLPTFSGKMSPKVLEHLSTVSARADFVSGVYAIVAKFSAHLNARLAAFFFGYLACPLVPCDDRGSEVFGGTDLLCIGEFEPSLYPPCLMTEKF